MISPEDRAAQIWCKPYMASKEMDSELCRLIAAEIEAYASECVQEASKSYIAQGYKEGVEAASQTQIRAAVKEAQHCCFEADSLCNNRQREVSKIKAEAYADAAEIAEPIKAKDGGCVGAVIAEMIRARAAEVGK